MKETIGGTVPGEMAMEGVIAHILVDLPVQDTEDVQVLTMAGAVALYMINTMVQLMIETGVLITADIAGLNELCPCHFLFFVANVTTHYFSFQSNSRSPIRRSRT